MTLSIHSTAATTAGAPCTLRKPVLENHGLQDLNHHNAINRDRAATMTARGLNAATSGVTMTTMAADFGMVGEVASALE